MTGFDTNVAKLFAYATGGNSAPQDPLIISGLCNGCMSSLILKFEHNSENRICKIKLPTDSVSPRIKNIHDNSPVLKLDRHDKKTFLRSVCGVRCDLSIELFTFAVVSGERQWQHQRTGWCLMGVPSGCVLGWIGRGQLEKVRTRLQERVFEGVEHTDESALSVLVLHAPKRKDVSRPGLKIDSS